MPERRRLDRRSRASLAIAVALVAGGIMGAGAPVALAVPGPGSECDAEAAPSGESESCPDAGVFDLGLVLPVVGGLVLAGLVAVGGAFLVARRRAARPLDPEPVDAEEWWTCRNCGRSNVVGSARCYACGAWQR